MTDTDASTATETAPYSREVYQHLDQATPGTAAHYALLFLVGRGLDPDLEADVGTVVALLVANACQHGEAPIAVRTVLDRDYVEIHVFDSGRITDFGPDHTGLKAVREITGCPLEITPEHVASGKTVIARIPYARSNP